MQRGKKLNNSQLISKYFVRRSSPKPARPGCYAYWFHVVNAVVAMFSSQFSCVGTTSSWFWDPTLAVRVLSQQVAPLADPAGWVWISRWCRLTHMLMLAVYWRRLECSRHLYESAWNIWQATPPTMTVCLPAISVGWVTFNVPPHTLQVISHTSFYGSNDPTNSVKALKEDRS